MKPEHLLQGIPFETVQQGACDDISGIFLDSRQVEAGGLFVCLRGLGADGHRFVEGAAQKGAAAVLIDRDLEACPPGLTVWKVSDTRKCLGLIAANFHGRPAEDLRLFGVTGTNGKTSTVYMLESVLAQTGTPVGMLGTVGARLGETNLDIHAFTTPDPPVLHETFAFMRDKGAKDVCMEVSSHSLALHKMAGLTFEVAVFTNLTQDHLDFHGTMENYLAAKAKLFGQCRYGVVNRDDKYSPRIMEIGSCQKWLTYGVVTNCDLRAIHIEHLPDGSAFDVEIEGVVEPFYLPVKGLFSIYNALAVIGAGLLGGLTPKQIRAGLADFKGVPGRIQSIPNDRGFHVLVDYAHTPDGLENIIKAVRGFATGKVVTLFGCGGDRDTGKRPIMGRIAGELSDHCILTSDNPRSEVPEKIIAQIEKGVVSTSCPYEIFVDRRVAIQLGISLLGPGDALIIAGKGHEKTQTIGDKILPFDDVAVATEVLKG